jgi:hypothetical protein
MDGESAISMEKYTMLRRERSGDGEAGETGEGLMPWRFLFKTGLNARLATDRERSSAVNGKGDLLARVYQRICEEKLDCRVILAGSEGVLTVEIYG